ncbi:MAG TPA: aldo/keto reductase [Bauldia sp.]|nr:aldo/keto reductase [Bauldia sp.]
MELRPLGPSGLRVSLVGLGCNNFGGRIDLAATRRVIDAALALGVNHLDTADIYGGGGKSEDFIGQCLGTRRNGVVLATKFGKPMADNPSDRRGTRAYIMSAVEASLRRLRTDWIDLLYMHEPDPGTPIEETLRAGEELVKSGKVRALAASNFSAGEIGDAVEAARKVGVAGFVATQDEYSLLERGIEDALLPVLETHRLSLVPYFPLAGGALTGKYRKGRPMPAGSRLANAPSGAERFLGRGRDEIVERLVAFADARGRTLLELALSWLAARPQVASIITGATKPEQIEANVKAVGWKLGAEELAEIDRITRQG